MIIRRFITLALVGMLLLAAFPLLPSSQHTPLSPQAASAQELSPLDQACVDVREETYQTLGTQCANLAPGETCFSPETITSLVKADGAVNEADFSEETAEFVRANLLNQANIIGQALDLDNELWSTAVLNVQSTLPASLSGSNLRFILLGNANVENDVEPEEALILPDDPLALEIGAEAATVYEDPDLEAPEVGTLDAGASIEVDGISPDGAWLRVFFLWDSWNDYSQRATAWISADSVAEGDFSSLPEIGPDSVTPYQEFFLNTFTHNNCAQTLPDPLLYVQGPEQIESDFVINGVEMRMTSSAIFQTVGDVMIMTVLTGFVRVYPETPGEIVVEPGQQAFCLLSDFESNGIDGEPNDRLVISCESETRPIGLGTGSTLEGLTGIPSNLLIEPIVPIIIIRPSGIGGPITEIIIGDDAVGGN